MSHGYQMVTWTGFKKRFDLWLLVGVFVYLTAFVVVSTLTVPVGESFIPIQTVMRATGTLAFLLLTFILCIGPLARLTHRFKPFLYNRRHLGVTAFLIALIHAGLVLLWYHGFSDLNVFVSLLVSNPRYESISGFPFESLGAIALIIMFLMAATSHDFWNANLGPGLWKALHMGVYFAFTLLVAHIALGAIQFEKHPFYFASLVSATGVVVGLHAVTAFLPSKTEKPSIEGQWLKVASVSDFEDSKAKIVSPPTGQRIAVFRRGHEVFAVSNVCRHQAGPLGEGKIIDGCITCPWHGFQYRPEDGCSPPPFTEKISTYRTEIRYGVVFVDQTPNPPGTPQAPSLIAGASS